MRHKRIRDIVIELTSLLDVVMILIFAVMIKNAQLVEASNREVDELQKENAAMQGELEKYAGMDEELANALGKLEEGDLEELLEKSRNVPFLNKGIVDKEQMLDLIKEIRLKLPDELKQAKWVKEERQRILEESKKEADGIVKEAENRIIAMIDEHEITRKAYDQKTEIIETANEMSREISKGTKEYADSLLSNTEEVLNETLNKLGSEITEALNLMQISLEDTIKTIQNSRRELK